MSSSNFAEAIVLSTVQLTPHMYRLTFRSEFAADFTLGAPGQYLKVLAPAPGEAGPPAFDPNTYKTQMRTYTLRHARPAEQEFDIDFVVQLVVLNNFRRFSVLFVSKQLIGSLQLKLVFVKDRQLIL